MLMAMAENIKECSLAPPIAHMALDVIERPRLVHVALLSKARHLLFLPEGARDDECFCHGRKGMEKVRFATASRPIGDKTAPLLVGAQPEGPTFEPIKGENIRIAHKEILETITALERKCQHRLAHYPVVV